MSDTTRGIPAPPEAPRPPAPEPTGAPHETVYDPQRGGHFPPGQ